MKSFPAQTHTGRWSVLFAVLTAATGITISLFLHSRIAKTEAATARLTADALRLHTEQELELFAEALESTPLLLTFKAANYNRAIIDEFIEKGMPLQHAVLGSFGLAQKIGPQTRAIEEKKYKQGAGYRVVHKGVDDTWVPARPQPHYYPLFFQSRPDALNIPVGFDLSSLHYASQAIEGVERTQRTMASPTPTFFSTKDSPSYWVFAPFDDPYEPNKTVGGVAVAILNPDTILKKVAALSAPTPTLQLSPAGTAENESILFADKAWIIRQPVTAMGTQWVFECSLPVTASERRSTAALIFGLTVTALMTTLLMILAGRTRHIEAEVQLRTDELRTANLQLEEILEERARMEEEMNELTARERRRIGRDLHDSLGQKLTGAVFLSRSLLNYLKSEGQKSEVGDRKSEVGDRRSEVGDRRSEDRCQETEDLNNKQLTTNNSSSPSPDNQQPTTNNSPLPNNQQLTTDNSQLTTQASHAQTLNETLKSAVAQVRSMARGLASVTLNEESLVESLDQLADEMCSLYHVTCTATQTEQIPLDRKTKEQLYFIAREAVNNAARHAQPKHIMIELNQTDTGWILEIEDDGIGLPGTQQESDGTCPAAGGMGLRIMRHRAGLIGAKFDIRSTPGQGTTIAISSTT